MDQATLEAWNGAMRASWLAALVAAWSAWGLALLPLLMALLWRRGQRRVAGALLVALAVSVALTLLFQGMAQRPRPLPPVPVVAMPPLPSFPSGHAALAFAAAALLALALRRRTLAVGMGLWAATVALSRVALGLHWLSDGVAGALLGAGVGAACYGLLLTGGTRQARLRWLLWPQLALVLLVTQMAYLNLVPGRLLTWPLADKVLHALAFGAVVFWLTLWWGAAGPRVGRWTVPLALALPLLLTTLEELLQQLSPLRSMDPADLAADLLGMGVAYLLARRLAAGRDGGAQPLPARPRPQSP